MHPATVKVIRRPEVIGAAIFAFALPCRDGEPILSCFGVAASGVDPDDASSRRTTVSAMAHDFTYVTNMTSAAGSHISQARSLAESIHDDSTKQAVRELVEAVGGAVDAINQLVETLK